MATKKTTTKRRLSSPALLSSRKRRKSTRRKRRSLRANIPGIGNLSLSNDLIGGAVGAALGMLLKNQIPDDLFMTDGKPSKFQPYVKAALIAGAALLAKHQKQPGIAAGLSAVATVLALQKLNVPGLSSGGMRRTNYVNPGLLSENIYPSYSPLYEQSLLSQGR